MPPERKFVLGLEEPDYAPTIHRFEEKSVLDQILFKFSLFILAVMGVVFILGLMWNWPISFIPAGIIGIILINRKNKKRQALKRTGHPLSGSPQGKPRTAPSAGRNLSNLRQSGFRR